jgi:hypothetical protein
LCGFASHNLPDDSCRFFHPTGYKPLEIAHCEMNGNRPFKTFAERSPYYMKLSVERQTKMKYEIASVMKSRGMVYIGPPSIESNIYDRAQPMVESNPSPLPSQNLNNKHFSNTNTSTSVARIVGSKSLRVIKTGGEIFLTPSAKLCFSNSKEGEEEDVPSATVSEHLQNWADDVVKEMDQRKDTAYDPVEWNVGNMEEYNLKTKDSIMIREREETKTDGDVMLISGSVKGCCKKLVLLVDNGSERSVMSTSYAKYLGVGINILKQKKL